MRTITINKDQELYVIPSGNGFSCLGFNVCETRIQRLSSELGYLINKKIKIGTKKHYNQYCFLVNAAKRKHEQTGWRSSSQLNPDLIGMEGKRIEAILYGEKTRFIIGKSTGFIPCHLEIKTKRSHGGGALPVEREYLKVIRVIS